MISQDRYFITHDTRLASALMAFGISDFLQIDYNRSTPQRIYFVMTNPKEAEKFEMQFIRNLKKLTQEVDAFRSPGSDNKRFDSGS